MRKRSEKQIAHDVIKTLVDGGFAVECPHCDESSPLNRCGTFYGDEFTEEARAIYERLLDHQAMRVQRLEGAVAKISAGSEIRAHAVNTGKILERLAPCMGSFRFASSDCRSLFDPIDYLIFEGLSKGNVTKVMFLELKTGAARLKSIQRDVRDIVDAKKVSMHVRKAEPNE